MEEVAAILELRELPNRKLGLNVVLWHRKSNIDREEAVVVAKRGVLQLEDDIQLMLVMRHSKSRPLAASFVSNRPSNGLTLCPLASHIMTPFPRDDAR